NAPRESHLPVGQCQIAGSPDPLRPTRPLAQRHGPARDADRFTWTLGSQSAETERRANARRSVSRASRYGRVRRSLRARDPLSTVSAAFAVGEPVFETPGFGAGLDDVRSVGESVDDRLWPRV